jgi:hypothetical protein
MMNSMFMWDSCSWRPTEPHCHGTALLPRRDQPREEGVIVFLWRRRGWLSPPEVCREVGLGVLSRPLRGRGPPCRRPVERGERDEPVGRAGHGGQCDGPGEAAAVVHSSLGLRPRSGRAAVLPMPSSTISVLSRRFRSTDPAGQLVSVSHGGPDGYASSTRVSRCKASRLSPRWQPLRRPPRSCPRRWV